MADAQRLRGGDAHRDSDGVYAISVAAKLAGMHPQTLRAYEREGLVNPERSSGNVRRYSDQDVERLSEIQRLTQDEGLNLAGVKMVLELREQMERLHRRAVQLERELERRSRQVREEMEAMRRTYRFELMPVRRAELEPYRRNYWNRPRH